MGIKGGSGSWFTVVHKNRTEETERIKKGFPARFTPPKICNNPECIKTTEAANALILSRCTPRGETGAPVVSTERGKRRHAKRGK